MSDESLNIMYTELRKTHYAYMLDYNITLGKNECNPGTTYQVKQICIVPSKDGIFSLAGRKHLTHTGIKTWESTQSVNLSKISNIFVDKVVDIAEATIVKAIEKFSIVFKFLDIMKELEGYASGNVKTTSGGVSTIRTQIYAVESMSYVFVKVKGVWQPILSSNMIIATDEIYVNFPIGDTTKTGIGKNERRENEYYYNNGEQVAAQRVHNGKTTLQDEVCTSLGFSMEIPMSSGKSSLATVYVNLNPYNTLQLFYQKCKS